MSYLHVYSASDVSILIFLRTEIRSTVLPCYFELSAKIVYLVIVGHSRTYADDFRGTFSALRRQLSNDPGLFSLPSNLQ